MAPRISQQASLDDNMAETKQDLECYATDVDDCRGDGYDEGGSRRRGAYSRSPSRERSRPSSFVAADDEQRDFSENRRTGVYGSQTNLFKTDEFESNPIRPRSRSASFSGDRFEKEVTFGDCKPSNYRRNPGYGNMYERDNYDSGFDRRFRDNYDSGLDRRFRDNYDSGFDRRFRDDHYGSRYFEPNRDNMPYSSYRQNRSYGNDEPRYRCSSLPRNSRFNEFDRYGRYDYPSRDYYGYPQGYSNYDQGNYRFGRGSYGTEGYGTGYGSASGRMNRYDCFNNYDNRNYDSYDSQHRNGDFQFRMSRRDYGDYPRYQSRGGMGDMERNPYRSSLDDYEGFGYGRNMPYYRSDMRGRDYNRRYNPDFNQNFQYYGNNSCRYNGMYEPYQTYNYGGHGYGYNDNEYGRRYYGGNRYEGYGAQFDNRFRNRFGNQYDSLDMNYDFPNQRRYSQQYGPHDDGMMGRYQQYGGYQGRF